MRRFVTLAALFLAFPFFAQAQEASHVPQYLQTLKPRCIGPANMSGRICEIAVYEKEPRIQYVASASGGLWKTGLQRIARELNGPRTQQGTYNPVPAGSYIAMLRVGDRQFKQNFQVDVEK